MKIMYRSAVIAALLIAASCGKDAAENIADQLEKEADQLEQTPLEANEVSKNVIIAGGTKKEGTPPVPNEALSFDISGTSKSAFLGEGFDITLNSDNIISGAYVQFKAADGTQADTYYDIDIDANSSGKKPVKTRKAPRRKSHLRTGKNDDTTINIDFTENIEPGTFCYSIRVYDTTGNISAPQELCVTVESWGGNADVIGTWNLTKELEVVNGESETIMVGEEECAVLKAVNCDAGGTVSADNYCYITESATLVFNEDGSFESVYKETEKELDLEATGQSCDAVYTAYENEFVDKGKWAYIKDEQKFVVFIYEWTEIYLDESDSATNDPGYGEIFVEDGSGIRFEGGALVFGVDQDSDDYSKAFYEK